MSYAEEVAAQVLQAREKVGLPAAVVLADDLDSISDLIKSLQADIQDAQRLALAAISRALEDHKDHISALGDGCEEGRNIFADAIGGQETSGSAPVFEALSLYQGDITLAGGWQLMLAAAVRRTAALLQEANTTLETAATQASEAVPSAGVTAVGQDQVVGQLEGYVMSLTGRQPPPLAPPST